MKKNQFKSKKVAIIGAGINGLYLAWKLSLKGHKVTVFEKKEKIGKEVCSGLFSEKILKFIPESKRLIQNEIDSVFINFPKKTVKVNFGEKFLVMDHAKLDSLVANLAQKAGAKIVLNKTIESLPEKFDKVIGCDGPNSTVRKELNLKDPLYRLAIQGFLLQEDNSDFVETWFIKDGFIWKIPRGAEVEYGIVAKAENAKNILDNFLAKNKIHLSNTRAAVIPQGFILVKNFNKVTLCGDAMGLTKPWSGGGVIWGLIAADILLDSFPNFKKYKIKLSKFFYFKIFISKIITKLVYFIGNNFSFILPANVSIKGDFLVKRYERT